MASRIKELVHARTQYPWSKWTNGSTWRAEPDADFTCSPIGFKSALHAHAYRKGFKVETSIKGDSVEFRFSKRRRSRKPSPTK